MTDARAILYVIQILSSILHVAGVCDPEGLICKPGCQDAIDEARKNPCLQGSTGQLLEFGFCKSSSSIDQ